MEFDERRYRPLSTVDLFDEAFDLYKRNFVLFLLIASIVVVPTTVLTDIFLVKGQSVLGINLHMFGTADSSTMLASLGAALQQLAITCALCLIPWTLIFSALTAAISARYLGKPITIKTAFLQGLRCHFSVLVSSALFLTMLFSGSIFLALSVADQDLAPYLLIIGVPLGVIVFLIVGARYPLFISAAISEKLGPIKALKRSSALTKTDTGQVFWAMLCMLGIAAAISSILTEVLMLLTGGIVSSAYFSIPALADNKMVAADLASGLASLLLIPFSVIVVTLIYYDQRIRKEGFDMDILAERLGYPTISTPSEAAYSPVLTTTAKRGKK